MNTSRSFDKHRCVRERVAAPTDGTCVRRLCRTRARARARRPPAPAAAPYTATRLYARPPGPKANAQRDGQRHAPRARTDEGTRAPPTAGPRGDGLRPRPAHGARTATPQTAGLRTQLCRLFGKRTGVDGCMLSDGTRLTPLNIIER